MLPYNHALRERSRELRKEMTESEQRLWSYLRGKQILGVQFYRQKPLYHFIVDFYAPKASLVIEVDGSQHMEESYAKRDKERDAILVDMGLEILRFENFQVLKETDAVVEKIFECVQRRIELGNPP